jgi:DMSO/TMAO reductase YedYZ heme-binding membrane subunit
MASVTVDSKTRSASSKGWKPNPGSDVVLPIGEKVRWLLGIWGVCLIYAIVRYNVFKGVEWVHLPLYVVNKSFAFGGLSFIAASYLSGKWIKVYSGDEKRRRSLTKFLGLTGMYFIGLHVFASLAMLSPVYYEKFFLETGKLSLTGELTVLFGVLGVGFLLFPAVTTLPLMYEALGGVRWQRAQRMGYWTLAMAAGHTFTMGFVGWTDVSTWPGGLPPITLLGFLVAASALTAKLVSGKR